MFPALPSPTTDHDGTSGDDGRARETGSTRSARTWDQELPRWLASLNPGRTQREYEKAVRYFFETPGVPPALEELTIDLLLAYRGALALRATPHTDGAPKPPRAPSGSSESPLADGPAYTAINSQSEPDALIVHASTRESAGEHTNEPSFDSHTEPGPTPLAPATVNVRLTALRQFLSHCALFGVVPQLPPERIRAALRRLRVERRRPYQVLAEPEWESFLAAAREPITEQRRAPWGRPRRRAADSAERTVADDETTGPGARSVTGGQVLTGARTADRDHALLALALATGLRAVEVAALDVGDLAREWHAGREEWWLVLPDAKTKGQRGGRTLPLAPDLVATIQAYLLSTGREWERPGDRSTPLFLSGRRGNKRLTPSSIGRIVDRVERQWQARQSGGEGRRISPHALRHSTAIALLEGNERAGRPPASVEHVRGWLGHFDIRTTQGYLAHLDARRHRRPFTLAPTSASHGEEPIQRVDSEMHGTGVDGTGVE